MTALDRQQRVGKVLVDGDLENVIVAQTGAVNPALVRLHVKENRKLTPEEIVKVVARYEEGASIRSLGKAFGLHEQTVRAHLRRSGVTLRPVRALTDDEEVEVVRLYVEEVWSLAELATKHAISQEAIRKVLVRSGVERRGKARRARNA